jgi:DNA polymerase-3 subunit alpha
MDKNGRPWAIVVMEDLDSTMEFAFFSEDYNKYLAFLEQGNRLYLKGFFKQSYRDRDKYELKVSQMEFLQDVLEKYCKGLRLMLHYKNLNEATVDRIYKIISKHNGKKPFTIYLYDDNEQPLTFQSGKTGVRITKDLFYLLSEIPDIAVKLII